MSYCIEKGIPHSEWLSWSAEDRAKHTAYLLEQAETCQLCGTASWEWKENPFAYEPEEEFCRGCYIKEVASEEAGKLPGTTITLSPVTELSKAQAAVRRRKRAGRSFTDEED